MPWFQTQFPRAHIKAGSRVQGKRYYSSGIVSSICSSEHLNSQLCFSFKKVVKSYHLLREPIKCSKLFRFPTSYVVLIQITRTTSVGHSWVFAPLNFLYMATLARSSRKHAIFRSSTGYRGNLQHESSTSGWIAPILRNIPQADILGHRWQYRPTFLLANRFDTCYSSLVKRIDKHVWNICFHHSEFLTRLHSQHSGYCGIPFG